MESPSLTLAVYFLFCLVRLRALSSNHRKPRNKPFCAVCVGGWILDVAWCCSAQLVPIDELKIMLKNKNITAARLEAIFDRSSFIPLYPPPFILYPTLVHVESPFRPM